MSSTNDTVNDSTASGIQLSELAPDVDPAETGLTADDYSRVVHVKGDEDSGSRRILLCYDTTADGELAFRHTLDKLVQPSDHVFMATVLPVTLFDASYISFAPEYSLNQDIALLRTMKRAPSSANAMKHLRERAAAFKAKGVDVTIHVAHGDPRYSLVAIATHHKVDMVVLGRRKLGRFQKLISPASVSSYVLTHADCTCVIVKE